MPKTRTPTEADRVNPKQCASNFDAGVVWRNGTEPSDELFIALHSEEAGSLTLICSPEQADEIIQAIRYCQALARAARKGADVRHFTNVIRKNAPKH